MMTTDWGRGFTPLYSERMCSIHAATYSAHGNELMLFVNIDIGVTKDSVANQDTPIVKTPCIQEAHVIRTLTKSGYLSVHSCNQDTHQDTPIIRTLTPNPCNQDTYPY